MTRSARQSKILELITKRDIETQEALLDALNEEGFKTTQATISRDIKELCLIKVMTENKTHKYTCELAPDHTISNKMSSIFKESVISTTATNNFVVVKTLIACAGAVSIFIDKLNLPEILGSIAGDDTVLLIARTQQDARYILERIKDITHKL